MAISGWEDVIINYVENIRVEIAHAGDEAYEEYKDLLEACARAESYFEKKVKTEYQTSREV